MDNRAPFLEVRSFAVEEAEPPADGHAEPALERHFEPLAAEAHHMLDRLADELRGRGRISPSCWRHEIAHRRGQAGREAERE